MIGVDLFGGVLPDVHVKDPLSPVIALVSIHYVSESIHLQPEVHVVHRQLAGHEVPEVIQMVCNHTQIVIFYIQFPTPYFSSYSWKDQ